jgi:HEAT repeat
MLRTALGVLLGSAALAWPAPAQTLAEVQRAAADCVGMDDSAVAARAKLAAWGNRALPFLRELSGNPDGSTEDHLVGMLAASAVRQVGTPEAVELLVEMLDGKTLVAPYEVLMVMRMMVRTHAQQLQSHVRFQQLVFKFAKKGNEPYLSDMTRKEAADIMAALGWQDGVPLLELMLNDGDQSVRKAAAEALTTLTGHVVDYPKTPLAFPRVAEQEELVFLVSVGNDVLRGRLDIWFDGASALVMSRDSQLRAEGREGYAREVLDPGFRVADFLSLPLADAVPRWILLCDGPDGGFNPQPEFAVCVDRERRELWRYSPSEQQVEAMCRLYGDSGCVGVAFGPGGEEGVVGFDLEGRALFRVPRLDVTCRLGSHPRLPGQWLESGGQLHLYDNQGRSLDPPSLPSGRRMPSGGYFYATDAVLAPGAQDEAVIIAGGQAHESVPTIVRCDAELNGAWRATLPDRVTSLALLEPPDRPALLAATTAGGDLFVFDMDGRLHQRLDITRGESTIGLRDVATYSISAGPLPDGGYGLAVGLLSNTLLYELR